MTEQYINILETYNKNENNVENFQEIKPKAVEQMLIVHTNLCSFVNACILIAKTDDIKKQFEVILDKLHHNNYFNDVFEVDENTYDVLYLDRNVKSGELDECTLTIHLNNETNKIEVSKWIDFGIKGEDYPMDCTIDDVVYTLDKMSSL